MRTTTVYWLAAIVTLGSFTTKAGEHDRETGLPHQRNTSALCAPPADGQPTTAYAPGVLLVQFTTEVSDRLDGLLRTTPARVQGFLAGLNPALARRVVQEVRPVFGINYDPRIESRSAGFAKHVTLIKQRFARRSSRVPGRPNEAAQAANLDTFYELRVTPESDIERLAQELRASPGVLRAGPNYYAQLHSVELPAVAYIPNDEYVAADDGIHWSEGSWEQPFLDLWGHERIKVLEAYDWFASPEFGPGAGVVAAVVDTGVEYTHPDLLANMWVNEGEIPGNGVDDDGNGFIDDTRGWDFASDDNDPMDGNGHGTHVAGTIAAVGNNLLGIIGIAPNARIMAVQGLSAGGVGYSSDLSRAIIYAADNGADVINNSWGCFCPGCPSNPVVEAAVRYAHGLGVVVVFSAGNDSSDVAYYSPQNMAETVTVASSDVNDNRSSFSNLGELLDVAAPGGGPDQSPPSYDPVRNILSVRASAWSYASLAVGDYAARQAGTSMSAPHVVGLTALILSMNPALSNEDVRRILQLSADDMGEQGFDTSFGHGRINAEQAMFKISIWPDCNDNDITDTADIAEGTSQDCTSNGIPDECEADCNANSQADICDILNGFSLDCNGNGIPDECEADCNANGQADSCDILDGFSPDCNGNGIPDECDTDCNPNGTPDTCDIADGTSDGCNGNADPDECDPVASAAENCSGALAVCSGITYAGSTVGASNDGSPICVFSTTSPDVWYSFTPAESGSLTISLCGSSYNTVLSVHTGCPGGTSNQVVCNDAACPGLQSEVTFDVAAGIPYFIRIAGYFGDTGNFQMLLTGPICAADCNRNGIPDECEFEDCNDNCVPDDQDIESGTSQDCNANAIPDDCEADCNGNSVADSCDILAGTSVDCNGNLTPDECETDCNGNGIDDACDLAESTSVDCNLNGVPDECDLAAEGSQDCNGNDVPDECDIADGSSEDCGRPHLHNCCETDHGAGCSDPDIEACVCANNVYCCDTDWYWFCVSQVESLRCGVCGDGNGIPDECEPDCNGNAVADSCDIAVGTSEDCSPASVQHNCCETDHGAGCSDPDIEACVCANNVYCCDTDWYWFCVTQVESLGCGFCPPGNGIPDQCEISDGSVPDCNANGIPDDCEPDCNNNGVTDSCDLSAGTSDDCNANDVPDDCEVAPKGSTAADNCGSALAVCPGITYTGSTVGASNDGSASCAASSSSPDVWYRFTPTQSGSLTISLCGSSYDTALSVHTGCPGGTTNQVACDDDFCGLQSQVTFDAADGTPYFIRISGYTGRTGNFQMLLTGPDCAVDCNNNGIPDECEFEDCNRNCVADDQDIASGTSQDCNGSGNGIPDECEDDCNANGQADTCDIATGSSDDCAGNGNGIPDDCEPDCNNNGSADSCDLASGTSADCNENGIPDDCDLADGTSQDCNGNDVPDECDVNTGSSEDCRRPQHNCCQTDQGVGCSDPAIETCVCAQDPYCCDTEWDSICVGEVQSLGCGDCGHSNGIPDECEPDCNNNGVADSCDIASGTSQDCTPASYDDVHDCCQTGHGAGCSDPDIAACVCAVSSYCCDSDWYSYCVDRVELLGCGYCDGNGIPDECDLAAGTSEDCNENGIADDCEPDCNNNGVADTCDLATGSSVDCDGDGIPDECGLDCNMNGVADICDVTDGTSQDCNGNGLPDECERDCNDNGLADSCDIAAGTSGDCNRNTIPDECDLFVCADYGEECTRSLCAGSGCVSVPYCQLHGDVFPPGGNCVVDIDDIVYMLLAFADPDPCANLPGTDLFPCAAPCIIVDIDDIVTDLAAFAGNYDCPHPCPP